MHQRSALLLVCVSTLVPLTFTQPVALAEPAPATANQVQPQGLHLLYADTDVLTGQKAGYSLQYVGADGERADRIHGNVTVTIDGAKTTYTARLNHGFAIFKNITWDTPSTEAHTLEFTATADDGTVLGTAQASTRVQQAPPPEPEPDASTSSLLSSGISLTPGNPDPSIVSENTKYYMEYARELEKQLAKLGK